MSEQVDALLSMSDPDRYFFNCRCGWKGSELLYVGYTYTPMETQLVHGQGVCPTCHRPFQGCIYIQEQIEINGISFRRSREAPGNIWDVLYVSDALETIDDLPMVIKLRRGQRVDGQAWSASLHVAEHCLYLDNSEHSEASDAVDRVQIRLSNADGRNVDEIEHARTVLCRSRGQQ